jgi:hypothetical protein
MNKLLILLPLVSLVACSSVQPPPQAPNVPVKVKPNLDIPELSRTEVISAARDCVNGRMKPVVQSVAQKTDHGTILIPVGVNCEVYGPTYPQQ